MAKNNTQLKACIWSPADMDEYLAAYPEADREALREAAMETSYWGNLDEGSVAGWLAIDMAIGDAAITLGLKRLDETVGE